MRMHNPAEPAHTVSRRGVLGHGARAAGGVAAALLAACGPVAAPGKPAAGKVSGPVIYRDWRLRSGNPVDEAFYKTVRDGFLAKYPDVKWEQEQVPFGQEYLEKFVASAAAGTAPQVVFSSVIWARDWWEAGVLEDLGPYIARTASVAPKNYVEPALFYNSWKGKTFGIPHVGPDFRLLYVNRRLLRESGIDPSDEALAKWTWNDMAAHHQKLVRRDGDRVTRAGIWFFAGASLEDFATYLYANGGQLYNKDRNGAAFNTAQGQQVLEFLADWRNKHRGHEGPQGVSTFDAFLNQAAAVVSLGSWNMRDIRGNSLSEQLDYTMMNIPYGPSAKQQATCAWTNMNIMPRENKNKDAAWAFMEWYSGLDLAKQMFDVWKQVSPRKDFLESAEWKQAQQRVPAYGPWRKIAETGGSYPYIKFAEVNDKMAPLLREAVVEGKRSVRDALGESERQANLVLSQVK